MASYARQRPSARPVSAGSSRPRAAMLDLVEQPAAPPGAGRAARLATPRTGVAPVAGASTSPAAISRSSWRATDGTGESESSSRGRRRRRPGADARHDAQPSASTRAGGAASRSGSTPPCVGGLACQILPSAVRCRQCRPGRARTVPAGRPAARRPPPAGRRDGPGRDRAARSARARSRCSPTTRRRGAADRPCRPSCRPSATGSPRSGSGRSRSMPPYLVNLAGPEPDVLRPVRRPSSPNELRVAPACGARFVNVHVGSHSGAGLEAGIERFAEGCARALGATRRRRGRGRHRSSSRTASGGGFGIGTTVEELGAVSRRRSPRASGASGSPTASTRPTCGAPATRSTSRRASTRWCRRSTSRSASIGS